MRNGLVGIVVVAALLAGCGDHGVTSTASAAPTTALSTTTATTPTTTTPPTTAPALNPDAGQEWVAVGNLGFVMDQNLEMDITAGGPGLVMVGSEPGPEGQDYEEDAAVWVSADGFTWTQVQDPAVLGGPGEQKMLAVTRGGPGLVAVGIDSPSGSVEDQDGAVWVSADGYAWTRVEGGAAFEGAVAYGVTTGGPGLVAVGAAWPNGLLWVSADGYSWTRIDDEALFREAVPSSITAGGPGLIAVGVANSWDMLEEQNGAVWASADGYAWARVEDEAVFEGAVPGSVTEGGPGLVAVGSDWESRTGVVWVSADGLAWTRIEDEAMFGLGQVTRGGPGLVALTAPWGTALAALWLSADGYTWTGVDRGAFDGSLYAVASWAGGLVAAGHSQWEGRTVWISPPPG